MSFLSSLNFFFNFDFQMHKTHLKRFAFEILFSEIIIQPFISLLAKFEVNNVFGF